MVPRVRSKRQRHAVAVRESFQPQGDQVRLALLFKTQAENQWRTLVEVERPRLKTARHAAYDAALAQVRASPAP